MSTPILPLAVWQSGTNQNSIPANDNALRIEALNREIISQAVTAQPASPTDGDTYIIAATHTGAQWATFAPKDIAIFKSGTWYAWEPTEGLIVNVAGSEFKFDGAAWVSAGGGMTNPMTTTGDIIYSSGGSTPARLGVGSNGYVLTLAAGLPTWAAAAGGFSNPMTTVGDLILGSTAGAAVRLAAGTAAYVLTSNGPGVAPTWQASSGGGGGLTGFTSALSTASPNATVNISSLLPSGGTTNQTGVYGKKGTGAIQAQIADSTATGGNVRGLDAVDFQAVRTAAAQVASGDKAAVLGGRGNTASGSLSFVGGGDANSATQNYGSVAGGLSNTASGVAAAVPGGNANVASGDYSFAAGRLNTASASSAIAIGISCTAAGTTSFSYGDSSTDRSVTGARSWATGRFASVGDAQTRTMVLRASTANATPTVLTNTGSGALSTNQMNLPTGSAYKFRADVAARNSSTGDMATWVVIGAIKNVGGTVSLVGTPTVTQDFTDAAATVWALAVTADNSNKTIAITATGAAATGIKWVASIDSTEVVG